MPAVDAEHPAFNSLLGALKAVHTGAMGMDVLERYHAALSRELHASRDAILALDVPAEFRAATEAQTRISVASLDVVLTLLDAVARYVRQPSQENVAQCVDLLLQSQRVVRDVNAYLDANVERAQ